MPTNNPTLPYTHNDLEAGGAPTVVFVHGAGGCIESWPDPWQQLRFVRSAGKRRWMMDFPLYFVDLPGHGRSADPGRDTIATYAQDITRFIESLNLQNVVLVGHSMGGAISQTIALSQPSWLAGLILLGTGAKMTVGDIILDGLLTDFAKTVSLIMKFSWHKQAPDLYKDAATQHLLSTPPAIVHGDFLACSQFDVRDRLGEIAVPTLVVGGKADRMMPLSNSAFLAEHIPNARLTVIEEAGHFMMVEKTPQVSQAIVAFLNRVIGD